jgi:glycosyltransferase involved in cell wall biosynthesis
MPRVSIVMAVYNGARHIDQALDSLAGQSFADLEIIVVDDGSTDATATIVARRAAADARIRLVTRANAGRPSIPRNDGLALARGDYVGFLDHDDFSHPERLAVMVDALERQPGWIAAFHDLDLVDADGAPLGRTLLEASAFRARAADLMLPRGAGRFELAEGFGRFASLYSAGMHTQSVLIARARTDFAALRFDPRFAIVDDTDLWMRLALAGTIGFVDRVLGGYRQHPGSLMTRRRAYLEDNARLHAQNYERVRSHFDAATLAMYRERIGAHHASLAWHLLNGGQPAAARAALRDAERWWPSAAHRRMLLRTWLPGWAWRALRAGRTSA